MQVKKGSSKPNRFQLGVADAKLGSVIHEQTGIPCVCNDFVGELLRGVRTHASRFLKNLDDKDLHRSQLGLAHSYSRAKVRGIWLKMTVNYRPQRLPLYSAGLDRDLYLDLDMCPSSAGGLKAVALDSSEDRIWPQLHCLLL